MADCKSSLSASARRLCGALLLLACAGAGFAQDEDPSGRIGRVNTIEGQAAAQLAGAADWTNDVLNRPMTTGDKLWVDVQSRAELQVGSALVSLGDQTGVQILNLDDRTTQLRLTAGSINVRVRSLADGENFEIDTPSVAVALLNPGEYHLDVNEAGDVTEVAVIGGQAQVTSPTQAYTLQPRERGEFSGTESVAAGLGDLAGPDNLDLWAEQREQRSEDSQSSRYVSDEVPGSQDLDESGTWDNDANYGPLWQPRVVVVGWAPYHYGHWVWVSPWGWTWIDDARWGFAPFHYGRWVHLNRGWCWSPGRTAARPVYAPALVAWVGGPGFSAAENLGGPGPTVAWFALGYNEVYRPGYRASNNYLHNVNVTNTYITNTTIINNTVVNHPHFANQNVMGAVAAVPHDAFVAARPVGPNLLRVDSRTLAVAAASTTAIAIAPTAQSWALNSRDGGIRARPPVHAVFDRPLVTRTAPPGLVPLEAQRRSIVANGAHPVAIRAVPNMQTMPSARINVVAPNIAPQPISVIGAMPYKAPSGVPNALAPRTSSPPMAPQSRIDRPAEMRLPQRLGSPAPPAQSQQQQDQFRQQQFLRQEQLRAQQAQEAAARREHASGAPIAPPRVAEPRRPDFRRSEPPRAAPPRAAPTGAARSVDPQR